MYQKQAIWCLIVDLESVGFAKTLSPQIHKLDKGSGLTPEPVIPHLETKD